MTKRRSWRSLTEAAVKAKLAQPSVRSRPAESVRRASQALERVQPIKIVGIDPGSQLLGFGVLEWRGREASYVDSGTLKAVGTDYLQRVADLNHQVIALFERVQPDEVVIERAFVSKNSDSALKLGQVRGVVMAAAFSRHVKVIEYSPRSVKQSVTGMGGASKEMVQRMVGHWLTLTHPLLADEADALAVALCHVHQEPLTRYHEG